MQLYDRGRCQVYIYLRLNASRKNEDVYSSSPCAVLMSLDTPLAIGRNKSIVLTSPAAVLTVTTSTHHSSFREVNSPPQITQETVHFLWITKAHYHFHNSPLPVPVLSQMNLIHNSILCNMHFSLPQYESSE